MMLFLGLYVFHNCRNVRFAHAERSVTRLPCELANLIGRPTGRIRFDRLDGFRNRDCRGELQQEMKMVLYAANRVNKYFLSFANPGCVRPETLFHVLRDDLASLFGAEHDVYYVLKIRVRQCVAPPALNILKQLSQRSRAGLTS